ncbi:MAG: hypothetical protein JWL66_1428 [Sphingomonadales bacterium]|jgi:hypothetical protein|nr:hypothetical protein [Sphingomonadales bacterium]
MSHRQLEPALGIVVFHYVNPTCIEKGFGAFPRWHHIGDCVEVDRRKGNGMTLASQICYFERREAEERRAARNAPNAALKEIFDVIADRYADHVWSLIERQFDLSPEGVAGAERTVEFEQEEVAEPCALRSGWSARGNAGMADRTAKPNMLGGSPGAGP